MIIYSVCNLLSFIFCKANKYWPYLRESVQYLLWRSSSSMGLLEMFGLPNKQKSQVCHPTQQVTKSFLDFLFRLTKCLQVVVV